jgi:AraC-like DNA-binding protein
MFDAIYTGSTAALAVGLFTLGLLFYSMSRYMESPVLRKALRMMVFTYCFFGFVNVLEVGSGIAFPGADDVLLFRITTLFVAVFQAFMFTYTMILLIHAEYVTRKRMQRELIPILSFSLICIAAYFVLPAAWVDVSFLLFTLFYIYLLIKYTRLFIITRRDCLRKMDNFFSGQETKRLQWINFSFYAALSIGLLALITSLTPGIITGIICTVIYYIFYIYFAVRLIGYVFVYKKLEEALSDDNESKEMDDKSALPPLVLNMIETNLKDWINEKQFLQADITIDAVARYIGTNKKYLSVYINTCKKQTFRGWINALRIEEAKTLLLEHSKMTVREIALHVGIATESHFGKQFRACTGFSPSHYRQQNSIL